MRLQISAVVKSEVPQLATSITYSAQLNQSLLVGDLLGVVYMGRQPWFARMKLIKYVHL